MKRPLRIAMLAHSTNPRGGVMHAMHVAEALTELGCEVVLHAPDAKGQGFFRTPKCEARAFPVGPASAETFAMIEQRVEDYVAHFSFPRNRGFDIYHAQDGISGNGLAALKQRGLIGAFVRTVHHIDDFPDERIARLDSRAIREADAWLTVSALWRDRLAETFAIQAAVCGNGVDIAHFRPDSRRKRGRAARPPRELGQGPSFYASAASRIARTRSTFSMRSRGCSPSARTRSWSSLAARACWTTANTRGNSVRASPRWARRRLRCAFSELSPTAICRAFTASRPRSRSSRSRKDSGSACWRPWRAAFPSSSRRSNRSRATSRRKTRSGAIPSSVTSIAEAMALALDEKFAARLRGRGRAIAARFDWRAVARAHEPVYQRMTELAHA